MYIMPANFVRQIQWCDVKCSTAYLHGTSRCLDEDVKKILSVLSVLSVFMILNLLEFIDEVQQNTKTLSFNIHQFGLRN